MKSNLFVFLALIFFASPAKAEINIHGFGDLVTSQSNSDYAVNSIGNRGKTIGFDEESRLGLNLSSELGEKLSFASQIVARGAGGGYYNLRADWLFLTYRATEHWSFRMGRQIIPAFIFSEQTDVGYTYIWARLPHQVYGTFPVKSVNGVSALYTVFFGKAQLVVQAFAGGGELVLPGLSAGGAPSDITTSANALKGAAATLTVNDFKFHLHYNSSNHSKVYFSPSLPSSDLKFLQVFTAGASYDSSKFLVIAEGIRALGNSGILDSTTAGYTTFGYHVTPVFTPYISGAWRDSISATMSGHPSVAVPTPRTYLTSTYAYSGGLNFRLGLSTVLKAEFMRTGFRFVDNSLNYRVNTVTASADFVF
ncbi:MAG: hypothetical protein AB7K68_00920 [Bacteriovoracia bacterium]